MNILLISYYNPSKFHAGGVRILDICTQIKQLNCNIHIDLVTTTDDDLDCFQEQKCVFDSIYVLSKIRFTVDGLKSLNLNLNKYQTVDLQYHQSGKFIRFLKKINPKQKVVFSCMESRMSALKCFISHIAFNQIFSKQLYSLLYQALCELIFISKSDVTVFVSDGDLLNLHRFFRSPRILSIPTCLPTDLKNNYADFQFSKNFSSVVYFAYFKSPQNLKSLHWYLEYVHPLISSQVPEYKFYIAGYGLENQVIEFCDYENIYYVGQVTEIKQISEYGIGIAPVFEASGVRGKINQYSFLKIPTVTTTKGLFGLGYENNKNILVGDTPIEFASQCVKLMNDRYLHNKISKAAFEYSEKHYRWECYVNQIKFVYM